MQRSTGQDYDTELSDVYFDGAGLIPDECWPPPGDRNSRLASMLARAEAELSGQMPRPDAMLILGDTDTVPVFCLAARRYAVPGYPPSRPGCAP